MAILKITDKKEEKMLRHKTLPFDFKSNSRKEIDELVRTMRKIMIDSDGVGLAANQIGINSSVFVARVLNHDGHMKFYAIFNPKIERFSSDTAILSEGCLSIPNTFGEVRRSLKITLTGFNKQGKPLKIKAWGMLAHVFQHEVDHLNGILFIDKTKKLYDAQTHESTKN